MKTTVIHHSADFDGIFCRAIARKFLPDAELIGWDFADKPLNAELILQSDMIYVLDLPLDRPLGFDYSKSTSWPTIPYDRIVWIDHHGSSIASHPASIPGYRIDGVAACRLAWQWFQFKRFGKQAFVERKIVEPWAVRLAGEYDIWDKRDPDAEVFQFGLRSCEITPSGWESLLDEKDGGPFTKALLQDGLLLQRYQQRNDASMMHRSYILDWEGLKFLVLNTARFNSLTFASKDVPETGHDALMGYTFNGEKWNVSLYHAKHRMDLDLSKIAIKHGGGGHKGACGFTTTKLPFLPV